ncbi:anti-repressor SinI family protein [Virgibacillus necropolis]
MVKTVNQTDLDYEWVELLQEAKSIGITVEEVRLFLNEIQTDQNINH